MSEPTDVISSEDLGARGVERRHSDPVASGARAVAIGVALSLVLSAGVATALYRTASGRPDPAQVVPASAVAVAVLDFGLGKDQEGSIEGMLGRFSAVKLPSGGSLKDRVFRVLTQDADTPVDYDRDVKPWLGDKVVVAEWLDHGQQRTEVAMQSRDDNAFRRHAKAAFAPDGHYLLQDGFVLLSDSGADVRAAVDAASHRSLASNRSYSHDVALLPGGEAIEGWVNGPATAPLLRSFVSPAERPQADLGFKLFGALSVGDLFNRHFAFGMHVSGDAVRLDLRDVDSTLGARAPSTMLTSLPAGTAAAIELGDPGRFTDDLMQLVRELGPLISPDEALPASPAELFQLGLGIRVPQDVKSILGQRAVVAFGGLELGSWPDIAIRTHPTNFPSAQSLAQRVGLRLSQQTPLVLDVSNSGKDLVLATSSTYGAQIAKRGTLGQQARVKSALADMPSEVTTAGYVDLDRVVPLFSGNLSPDVQHLRAAGYWVADSGDVQSAQLSLIIN